jgi:hypothetical protein
MQALYVIVGDPQAGESNSGSPNLSDGQRSRTGVWYARPASLSVFGSKRRLRWFCCIIYIYSAVFGAFGTTEVLDSLF